MRSDPDRLNRSGTMPSSFLFLQKRVKWLGRFILALPRFALLERGFVLYRLSAA